MLIINDLQFWEKHSEKKFLRKKQKHQKKQGKEKEKASKRQQKQALRDASKYIDICISQ